MKMHRFFLMMLSLGLIAACEKEVPAVIEPADVDYSAIDLWNLPDISGSVKTIEGPTFSVKAGIGEPSSRTFLSMNSAGTNAEVHWRKGDCYYAFYEYASQRYYSPFYTQDDDVKVATFSSNYFVDGKLHCIYPDFNGLYVDPSDGTYYFGVTLAHEQNAVAGGVDPSLLHAYTEVDDPSISPSFHSVPSLVRFRMSGSATSSVTSITLRGADKPISGDYVLCQDNGLPARAPWRFTNDQTFSNVILKGSFVAGEDYYFAVLPGDFSKMILEFSDANGNSIIKSSSSKITCQRSRIVDLGTIDIGSSFDGSTPAPSVLKYMSATAGTKPISMAVISEGFKPDQLNDYILHAESGVDFLFETEPYKTYKDRFNVWILSVASNEEGATITDGNSNIKVYKDTYFGAKWGEDSYGDMRADDNIVFNFVSQNCPDIVDGSHTIAEVPILMIINDPRYGGMNWSYSNGQAYAMVPIVGNGTSMGWGFPSWRAVSDSYPSQGVVEVTQEYKNELGISTGTWRNTLVHEFGGHAFGRLKDEYWLSAQPLDPVETINGHNWSVPFGLNISPTYADVLWQADLLFQKASLVAKDARYDRIGVFQGGDYSVLNRWRSERTSCMVDNRAYFSAWQRELIVKRIMSLSGDTFSLEDFLAKDVTFDPVRDGSSSASPAPSKLPVKVFPMTPPPGLVTVD